MGHGFITKKCRYFWGLVYDLDTGEKIICKSDNAWCREGIAFCLFYTEGEKWELLRLVFVDE